MFQSGNEWRDVPLFLLGFAAFMAVAIALLMGVRAVSHHYGWDGCRKVDFGEGRVTEVCDR